MNTISIILIICISVFCVPLIFIQILVFFIYNVLFFYIVIIRYEDFPLYEYRVTTYKVLFYGGIFVLGNVAILTGLHCFCISLIVTFLLLRRCYNHVKVTVDNEKKYNKYMENNNAIDFEMERVLKEEQVEFCDNSDRLHSDSGKVLEKYTSIRYQKLNEEILLCYGYKYFVLYDVKKREVVTKKRRRKKGKLIGICGFERLNDDFSFFSDGEKACIVNNYDFSTHKELDYKNLIHVKEDGTPVEVRFKAPKAVNDEVFYFKQICREEIIFNFYDTQEFKEKYTYSLPIENEEKTEEYWYYHYSYYSFDFVMKNRIFVHVSHDKIWCCDTRNFKIVYNTKHNEFPFMTEKHQRGEFIFTMLAMEYTKKSEITPDVACFFLYKKLIVFDCFRGILCSHSVSDEFFSDRDGVVGQIEHYKGHIAIVGFHANCSVFKLSNSFTNVDFVRKIDGSESDRFTNPRFHLFGGLYLLSLQQVDPPNTGYDFKIENLLTKKSKQISMKTIQTLDSVRGLDDKRWVVCSFSILTEKNSEIKPKQFVMILKFSESKEEFSFENEVIYKGDINGVTIFSRRLAVFQLYKKFIVWELNYFKELKYFMCLVWERKGLVGDVLRHHIIPHVNPMWFLKKYWKNALLKKV